VDVDGAASPVQKRIHRRRPAVGEAAALEEDDRVG
jgi:hypothetical protein